MSQEFATLQIWIAASLGSATFAQADSNKKFENDAQIKLDYCSPQLWVKKRTDVTGVQSDEDVHPDTGPAGAFVEIQFTVDRSNVLAQDFLSALIHMYGIILTDNEFKRGRIGLINSDNPQLDIITPTATLVYKLVQFQEIDPIDYKSRQIFKVVLQLAGKAVNLPNLS